MKSFIQHDNNLDKKGYNRPKQRVSPLVNANDHWGFHTRNRGSYAALLALESVDEQTAGTYPTLHQWQNVTWDKLKVQSDRWVFAVNGKGYVMRGQRKRAQGAEYVQLLLLENGEMTAREIKQCIRSLDTDAVKLQLQTLIDIGEVDCRIEGKKRLYSLLI